MNNSAISIAMISLPMLMKFHPSRPYLIFTNVMTALSVIQENPIVVKRIPEKMLQRLDKVLPKTEVLWFKHLRKPNRFRD